MSRRSLRWPRHFGFEIAGLGPSFVTRVDKGSIAFNSGLQAGDQILELDDQDVTNMSAKAIRTLAKHSRTQPPTLGVVSRRIQTELVGSKRSGLGMRVSETKPVTVDIVDIGSSAESAGIQKGSLSLSLSLSLTLSLTLSLSLSLHLLVPVWLCRRCLGNSNKTKQTLWKHTYSNVLKILPPTNEKFSEKKIWYFSYFRSKHRLLVPVRTASTRRF